MTLKILIEAMLFIEIPCGSVKLKTLNSGAHYSNYCRFYPQGLGKYSVRRAIYDRIRLK